MRCDRFSPGRGGLGRPADLELRRRIPGRQRFGQAGPSRGPGNPATPAQSAKKARAAARLPTGRSAKRPGYAAAPRSARAGGGLPGEGRRRKKGRKGAGEKGRIFLFSLSPFLPFSLSSTSSPYHASAHAAPGVPATAARSCQPWACNSPSDPLDQRRFAAEQMDDTGNIQQHALGKNVRIDAHQGRELLASRRHGLQTFACRVGFSPPSREGGLKPTLQS